MTDNPILISLYTIAYYRFFINKYIFIRHYPSYKKMINLIKLETVSLEVLVDKKAVMFWNGG